MYRRLSAVLPIVVLISLSFASVGFAQGAGSGQGQNSQDDNAGAYTSTAFTSLGQGQSVAAGQRQWYKFDYAGDNSPIQISLTGAGMQFTIWSMQDLANSGGNLGPDTPTVGRGTPNAEVGADSFWTGSFNLPGTYYIMVERTNGGQGVNSNAGGNYNLQVSGTGVIWHGPPSNSQQNTSAGQQSRSGGNGPKQPANIAARDRNNGSVEGVAPRTLPAAGGEMPSVWMILIGGVGALGVAARAALRRKK